jgi:diguanylate cyclase
MSDQSLKTKHLDDFRIKSTLGVTIITLFILAPFAVNNFLQDRYVLGIGSMGIIILCATNAWNCIQKRYHPSLILLGLLPAITIFLIFAFRQQGAIIAFWCYPVVLGFYFMLPERQAWISNIVFLGIIFPQAWVILEQPFMIRFVVTILGVSAFSAMFMRVITAQQKMLETQAVTDPLTGLFNRTMLNDTFDQAIQQNHRTGTPMTLLVLDIDHFKMINDELGHNSGDGVLRSVGEFFLKRIRRRTDKVFRIGGEEFLVLLYDTDLEHGRQVAEELCSGFASLPLLSDRSVTVSIGVATLQPDEDWVSWMKRGDKNLYKAKLDGRNRVVA